MVAKLVVEEGDQKGLSLSLEHDRDTWIIGHDPDVSQFVIEDSLVERKHVIVRRTSEGIIVENLSQANPMQINDEEMDHLPHLLQNGDTLKVGKEIFRFYEDSSAQIIPEEVLNDREELQEEKSVVNELKGEEEWTRDVTDEMKGDENNEKSPTSEMPEFSEDTEANAPFEEFQESEIPANARDEESDQEQRDDETLDQDYESAKQEEARIEAELASLRKQPGDNENAEETELSPEAKNLIDNLSLEAQRPAGSEMNTAQENTIFSDDELEMGTLAEIDYGVFETGRWLLKVIGGPNTGAEFHMQTGSVYTLGTDPKSSDIVFHDTSVSRQHAKISVSSEDILTIEDLKSRNGVLVSGESVTQQELPPNTIVSVGTTSFVVYDCEGEMQTIISPLLPSIVKVLQQEPVKEEKVATPPVTDIGPEKMTDTTQETAPIETPPKHQHSFTNFIILSAIFGLFALAAMGTSSLFQAEPVVVQTQENGEELIQNQLQPFQALRYTFNKGTGGLLLLGHVMNAAEKNQLLFNLQNLKFIKSIDDTGIIIDESVWHELNSILSENPAWRGISIHSPKAGQFILSGYLETRKQAEQLSSYIGLNFPYLDLLKKQIVVEEDVVNQINQWLQGAHFTEISAKMANGEVTLTGGASKEQNQVVDQLILKIKGIPGVRIVNNLIKAQSAEPGFINITDHYPVSGKSRVGNKYTVLINGRILSEGNDLDGMTINQISANRVMLEKDGIKYRIDY